MRIVFSSPNSHRNYLQISEKKVNNLLFTFAENSIFRNIEKYWINKDSKKLSVWVDSGAFTTWNSGKEFDIYSHIQKVEKFYNKFKDNFKEIYFITLDIIPGKPGIIPTQKQRDDSAKKTFENYLISRKSEIIPKDLWLVTLHQHEDPQLILEYQKYNNYLCISPANDQNNDGRSVWLDKVFSLLDSNIKSHGLAVTGELMLERYPWYSVDSISWKLPGMWGQMYYTEFFGKKILERINKNSNEIFIRNLTIEEVYYNNYSDLDKIKFQIDYFLNLEEDITKLWKIRGIEWKK